MDWKLSSATAVYLCKKEFAADEIFSSLPPTWSSERVQPGQEWNYITQSIHDEQIQKFKNSSDPQSTELWWV